jgi:hypothetical protein
MAVIGGTRVVGGVGSALKGRKVPPKYRSPSGETWAGRGARPRWLVAAIKGGKNSTKGTEKAQVEAMTLVANGTDRPNSTWRIISAIEICHRRPDTLRLRLIDLMGSGRTNVWREPLEAVETDGELQGLSGRSRSSPIPAETHPKNNLSDRH